MTCNNKEPHSHLVMGKTFECEQGLRCEHNHIPDLCEHCGYCNGSKSNNIDKIIEWAKLFHDTYESLAGQFGYETRPETREFNSESPNGKLMIAVCDKVITEFEKQIRNETLDEVEEGLPKYHFKANNNDFLLRNECIAEVKSLLNTLRK